MIKIEINTTEKINMGNDLVKLSLFKESFNPSFVRSVYHPSEQEYCNQFSDSLLRYASTFAAKEAIYKAVKQWDPSIKMRWRNIVISRSKYGGKPSFKIIKPKLFFSHTTLTITHEGEYVWAMVLLSDPILL